VAKLFEPIFGCDTGSLRALNVAALCLICPISYVILRFLRTHHSVEQTPTGIRATTKESFEYGSTKLADANTALNIALFPPLFFFSALFYTDVISTLLVLVCYSALLKKGSVYGTLFENINAVSLGLMALTFRQTNIFWVAVFPAGLNVISALRASARSQKTSSTITAREIIQESWNEGVIYDCTVQEAGLTGMYAMLMT
jgi:alpha-1,2-glucosyltransferase